MYYCAVCLGEHKKLLLLQQVVEGVQKIYSKNCCMALISQLYMDLPLPPVLYVYCECFSSLLTSFA